MLFKERERVLGNIHVEMDTKEGELCDKMQELDFQFWSLHFKCIASLFSFTSKFCVFIYLSNASIAVSKPSTRFIFDNRPKVYLLVFFVLFLTSAKNLRLQLLTTSMRRCVTQLVQSWSFDILLFFSFHPIFHDKPQ